MSNEAPQTPETGITLRIPENWDIFREGEGDLLNEYLNSKDETKADVLENIESRLSRDILTVQGSAETTPLKKAILNYLQISSNLENLKKQHQEEKSVCRRIDTLLNKIQTILLVLEGELADRAPEDEPEEQVPIARKKNKQQKKGEGREDTKPKPKKRKGVQADKDTQADTVPGQATPGIDLLAAVNLEDAFKAALPSSEKVETKEDTETKTSLEAVIFAPENISTFEDVQNFLRAGIADEHIVINKDNGPLIVEKIQHAFDKKIADSQDVVALESELKELANELHDLYGFYYTPENRKNRTGDILRRKLSNDTLNGKISLLERLYRIFDDAFIAIADKNKTAQAPKENKDPTDEIELKRKKLVALAHEYDEKNTGIRVPEDTTDGKKAGRTSRELKLSKQAKQGIQRKHPEPIRDVISLKNLAKLDLNTLPSDRMDAIDIEDSIASILLREIKKINTINDEDEKSLKKQTALKQAQEIIKKIRNPEHNGAAHIQEFIANVTNELEKFITKLEEKKPETPDEAETKKPEKTEDVKKEEREVEEEPATEFEIVEPDIEELLGRIIWEMPEEMHSAEIETDEKFIGWLERVAKRVYTSGRRVERTLTHWHNLYKENTEILAPLQALILDETQATNLFKGVPETERQSVREAFVTKLEWDLVINQDVTARKIRDLQILIVNTQKNAEHISKQQKELRESVEKLTKSNESISGEIAFDLVYGKDADRIKLEQFEAFLDTMDKNYLRYRGNTHEESSDTKKFMASKEAFDRYALDNEKTERLKEIDGQEETFIPTKRVKKMLSKLRYAFKSKNDAYNHNDFQVFNRNIKEFEAAELVPTKDTPKEIASYNMVLMRNLLNEAKAECEKGNLKQWLGELDGHEFGGGERFKKLFTEYIKNQGNHSSLQRQARASDSRAEVIENKETLIQEGDSRIDQEYQDITRSLYNLAGADFESFQQEIQQDLAIDTLRKIETQLTNNRASLDTLTHASKTLESVDIYALTTEAKRVYQRVVLGLTQAYESVIKQKPETAFIPNSAKVYETILSAPEREISKAKKQTYLNALIQTLKTKRDTEKNTLVRVRISKLIKTFEDRLNTLR